VYAFSLLGVGVVCPVWLADFMLAFTWCLLLWGFSTICDQIWENYQPMYSHVNFWCLFTVQWWKNFSKFASLLEDRKHIYLWQKLHLGGCTNSWQIKWAKIQLCTSVAPIIGLVIGKTIYRQYIFFAYIYYWYQIGTVMEKV